jgi:hypothetical protein
MDILRDRLHRPERRLRLSRTRGVGRSRLAADHLPLPARDPDTSRHHKLRFGGMVWLSHRPNLYRRHLRIHRRRQHLAGIRSGNAYCRAAAGAVGTTRCNSRLVRSSSVRIWCSVCSRAARSRANSVRRSSCETSGADAGGSAGMLGNDSVSRRPIQRHNVRRRLRHIRINPARWAGNRREFCWSNNTSCCSAIYHPPRR